MRCSLLPDSMLWLEEAPFWRLPFCVSHCLRVSWCRDVDLVKAGEVVQNVVCCGHCQNTSIQQLIFSPDDSMLVSVLPAQGCLRPVSSRVDA